MIVKGASAVSDLRFGGEALSISDGIVPRCGPALEHSILNGLTVGAEVEDKFWRTALH